MTAADQNPQILSTKLFLLCDDSEQFRAAKDTTGEGRNPGPSNRDVWSPPVTRKTMILETI